MYSIKIVMFDMDGTLVDSMPIHARAFGKAMNRWCGVPSDYASEIYIQTSGKPVEEQIDIVLNNLGLPKVWDKSAITDMFWDSVLESAPVLFPDVVPALESLQRAGCTMCVISGSAPFVVKTKMELCRIDSFFRLMLGSDPSIPGMTKGPGHLGIIRHELGLSAVEFRRSSVMVGDAEYDMTVARQAGVLAVARVTPETRDSLLKAGADYVIENLSELAAIITENT